MSEDTTFRIGAAIERVIEDLPEGFQLSMHMGGGMGEVVVVLLDPEGDTIPIPIHTGNLADVLEAAVDVAQQIASPTIH